MLFWLSASGERRLSEAAPGAEIFFTPYGGVG